MPVRHAEGEKVLISGCLGLEVKFEKQKNNSIPKVRVNKSYSRDKTKCNEVIRNKKMQSLLEKMTTKIFL